MREAMHLLPAERAALRQPSLATGGLAQDGGAALADDNGLGVREDGGDGEATGALDVHEEGSGSGDQGLVVHSVSTCRREDGGDNLQRQQHCRVSGGKRIVP